MTSQHHLVIITGANRGFGASLAHSYVLHSEANSISFVLVGRNHSGLEKVLTELQQITSVNVTVKGVVVGNVDLSNIETLDTNLARIQIAANEMRQKAVETKNIITKSVLINNAGSLGDLGKSTKEFTWQEARDYLDFNVVSFIGLKYEYTLEN
ncbi:hypothetical protein BX616_002099 [Lobosporangium transversale]|nr:hypothetical protein BX616_002099 [Lobosporangium transversale]